jgi:hypothetical protein
MDFTEIAHFKKRWLVMENMNLVIRTYMGLPFMCSIWIFYEIKVK